MLFCFHLNYIELIAIKILHDTYHQSFNLILITMETSLQNGSHYLQKDVWWIMETGIIHTISKSAEWQGFLYI